MKPKKLFIFLADGVGLRNFAFTKFYALGKSKGYDVVFWNASSFDLSALGYAEIKIPSPKNHRWTELVKNAQIQLELSQNKKRSAAQNAPSLGKKNAAFVAHFYTQFQKWLATHEKAVGLFRKKHAILCLL